jgi:hypothetical protein
MKPTRALVWGALAAALLAGGHHLADAGQQQTGWTHPRTPWGDPDLTGVWPITDLNGTPVQRPANFGERRLLTDDEYAQRVKQIEATRERTAGAWAEIGQPNRLTSLVVEPANGRLPPLTAEGRRRAAMTSTWSEMLFDRFDQFNPLDRCITRGLPRFRGRATRTITSTTSTNTADLRRSSSTSSASAALRSTRRPSSSFSIRSPWKGSPLEGVEPTRTARVNSALCQTTRFAH